MTNRAQRPRCRQGVAHETFGKLLCLAISAVLIGLLTGRTVTAATSGLKFDLPPGFGQLQSTPVDLAERGCIAIVVDSWQAQPKGTKASKIALILNGPGKEEAYARVDGAPSRSVPLWMSYSAASAGQWRVTVANFDKAGSAVGSARITYPPTSMPCEFRAVAGRDGTVKLTWKASDDVRVERANGTTWQAVDDCDQSGCIDGTVTRGKSYLYRACSAAKMCTRSDATTPPVAVTVR